MPPAAAATAATRVWPMRWPFHAQRKLSGLRLVATDHPWSAGQGLQVEGPIAAILLLLTGRRAALSATVRSRGRRARNAAVASAKPDVTSPASGTVVRAMRQTKHGYRADIAFDAEKAIPGGALGLVEDGVITGVEPGSASAPDGCEVTYLPGTTVLPGLIDTHSHLCGDSDFGALDRLPGLSPGGLDEAIEAALAAQLAAGVTAVRDLGDQQWAVVDRHRHRPGGPTVLASGPPITSAGGHCAVMGGQASGAGELRRAVRERAGRGADLVKIMTSGGVMTPATDVRACQFTTEEVRAVVDEAHRLGLAVTAHAHAQ